MHVSDAYVWNFGDEILLRGGGGIKTRKKFNFSEKV